LCKNTKLAQKHKTCAKTQNLRKNFHVLYAWFLDLPIANVFPYIFCKYEIYCCNVSHTTFYHLFWIYLWQKTIERWHNYYKNYLQSVFVFNSRFLLSLFCKSLQFSYNIPTYLFIPFFTLFMTKKQLKTTTWENKTNFSRKSLFTNVFSIPFNRIHRAIALSKVLL